MSDERIGQRVELHPATDRWMRGDRFGTVENINSMGAWVRFDRSGELGFYRHQNILEYLTAPR